MVKIRRTWYIEPEIVEALKRVSESYDMSISKIVNALLKDDLQGYLTGDKHE